jgi:hypothetical protein
MQLNQYQKPAGPEELFPVIHLNGFASQRFPVPALYAIRYLSRELELALETLIQYPQLQELLSIRGAEKDEIHTRLLRIMKLFQEFLMTDARR